MPTSDHAVTGLPDSRSSAAVPCRTRAPLIGCTIPWQVECGRDSHTAVIKATVDLLPGEAARLRDEPDMVSGDLHASDALTSSLLYPSDFAIFKPRCDVVLCGRAIPPKGPSKRSLVRFAFGARSKGGFDRRVAVFGPRRWHGTVAPVPGKAGRFAEMPLVWERAFGGPDYTPNPVGCGPDTDWLPNLEDPSNLIADQAGRPTPAGLGPIPMLWEQRWSLLGSYDARWLKERFPYFPDDFDWHFFQCAPKSQQLEHIVGDEPFALAGVHKEHGLVEGRLPGLRPRCFAKRTEATGGGLQEVALKLDTVVFDGDELKANLVYRGLLGVSDDEARDVVELYLILEHVHEPPTAPEDVRRRYLAESALDMGLLTPAEADALPANEAVVDKDGPSPIEQRIRERLLAAGVPIEPAPETTAAPSAPPEPEQPMEDSATAHAGRARAEQILAQGGSFRGADLQGADLSGMDLSGRDLVGANLKDARLVGCRFSGSDLSGAQLSGADLTAAQLDQAQLDLADLTGATLCEVHGDGLSLMGADLSEAQAERASLRKIQATSARFARGSWGGAHFDGAQLEGADFSGASLDHTCFDRATMPDVRLYDAQGAEASFVKAKLDDARAEGATLTRSDLSDARAPDSVWDGATLDGSRFSNATLCKAGFARASCRGTTFAGADLSEARLAKAQLAKASFAKADLKQASLEGGDLRGADLRGANLYGAETWKANFTGAKLQGAFIANTKLEGS